MSPYLSAVNEKLLFAGLLATQIGQSRQPHLDKALCHSIVLQLELAYRWHLKEIADNYQLRDPDVVSTIEALVSGLAAVDKHPAEAQEMAELEQRSSSWLNALLRARNALIQGPLPRSEPDNPALIPLRKINDSALYRTVTPASVRDWIGHMQEMIERHRDTMFEC